jgi:hypothetical protein
VVISPRKKSQSPSAVHIFVFPLELDPAETCEIQGGVILFPMVIRQGVVLNPQLAAVYAE